MKTQIFSKDGLTVVETETSGERITRTLKHAPGSPMATLGHRHFKATIWRKLAKRRGDHRT
jgi:hypothetical protein